MTHAIRMAVSVGDGSRSTQGQANKNEPLKAYMIGYGLEIIYRALERNLLDVALRQSKTTPIIAQERVMMSKPEDLMPKKRAFQVVLKVGHPVWRSHNRCAFADNRIGEAN